MNLRMAIRACPVEGKTGACQLRGRGVPDGGVTLLTEPGRTDFEQLGIAGAMRVMAVIAVLHDRRMLPEEGTAPLRVALVTRLIDGGGDEKFWIRASVRVVAVGAGNLALPHRHVRRTLELRPAHRMAFEANLHLRVLGEQPVVGQRLLKTCRQRCLGLLVDLVAGGATHTPGLVFASSPEQPLAFFVALQTAETLLFHRQRNVLAETDDELRALWTLICRTGCARGVASVLRRYVFARRSVARFTTSGFKFVARGLEEYFGHLRYREFSGILFMALLAGITAGIWRCVRRLLSRLREQRDRPTGQ